MALNLFVSETETYRLKVCHDLVDLRTEERLQIINDSDAEFVYLVRKSRT